MKTVELKALQEQLYQLKGAESSYPFGPDALVFKVMGKMFAFISQNEAIPRITLKCAPADGEVLIHEFESVTPGYHMNKKHWITISLKGDMPKEFIIDLANKSYSLVVQKLTKANRIKLQKIT